MKTTIVWDSQDVPEVHSAKPKHIKSKNQEHLATSSAYQKQNPIPRTKLRHIKGKTKHIKKKVELISSMPRAALEQIKSILSNHTRGVPKHANRKVSNRQINNSEVNTGFVPTRP